MSAEFNASQTETGVSFRERQKFKLAWLYALVIAEIAFVIAIMRIDYTPDAIPVLVIVFVILAAIIGFVASLTLTTEVRDDGVYVRMWPIHRQWLKFAFADIQSAQARSYDPMGEYLGWGIKGTSTNRVYNTSGNRGVQLVMKDGHRVLIGSQKADELAQAINGPAY